MNLARVAQIRALIRGEAGRTVTATELGEVCEAANHWLELIEALARLGADASGAEQAVRQGYMVRTSGEVAADVRQLATVASSVSQAVDFFSHMEAMLAAALGTAVVRSHLTERLVDCQQVLFVLLRREESESVS